MTGRHWLALAITGSGLVTLATLTLYAKGRKQEAFVLAFTAGLLSTTFAAARALHEPTSPHQVKPPSSAPGGVDSSSWAVA